MNSLWWNRSHIYYQSSKLPSNSHYCTSGTLCLADWYYSIPGPVLGEFIYVFSFLAACKAPSRTMNARQFSPELISLCPATNVCGVFSTRFCHLVTVDHQEQWQYPVVFPDPRTSLTNSYHIACYPIAF